MTRRHAICLTLLLTATFALSASQTAAAQENVRRCFEGPQYAEVIQLLQDWNEGKLILVKADLAPGFEEYVKSNAQRMPSTWAQRQRSVWSRLPDQLQPQSKLAAESQMLLLSLYSEQASEFMKRSAEERHRDLQRSLFIILGYAQSVAKGAAGGAINPSAIMRALIAADCGYFPFCDPAKRAENPAPKA